MSQRKRMPPRHSATSLPCPKDPHSLPEPRDVTDESKRLELAASLFQFGRFMGKHQALVRRDIDAHLSALHSNLCVLIGDIRTRCERSSNIDYVIAIVDHTWDDALAATLGIRLGVMKLEEPTRDQIATYMRDGSIGPNLSIESGEESIGFLLADIEQLLKRGRQGWPQRVSRTLLKSLYGLTTALEQRLLASGAKLAISARGAWSGRPGPPKLTGEVTLVADAEGYVRLSVACKALNVTRSTADRWRARGKRKATPRLISKEQNGVLMVPLEDFKRLASQRRNRGS